MTRRYIVCRCDLVYERTSEFVAQPAFGAFSCVCGAGLGAWSGRIALRYEPVTTPTAAILAACRRAAR